MKTSLLGELHAAGRFESFRKLLTSDTFAPHLEKPLAHWAVPGDRRLPLALLGRTLGELLRSPFDELAATPGIGRVKLQSFFKLLARAAKTTREELELPAAALSAGVEREAAGAGPSNGFDPSEVSEVVWAQWRAGVVQHGLGKEPLGRFAPTLRDLPRTLWNTPLETYAAMTLAEIRSQKTHGEKRVRGILAAFHSIHAVVANIGPQTHLVLRILPRNVDAAETWLGRTLQTPDLPRPEDVLTGFINPLLDQVRTDATRQVAALAESRLGLDGPITSIRRTARTLGLTRVRVYQLLNEIDDILNVRWPTGRHQVYELDARLRAEMAEMEDPPALEQFFAAVELFYTRSRRGAAGPLERAPAPHQSPATGLAGNAAGTAGGNGRRRSTRAVPAEIEQLPAGFLGENASRLKKATHRGTAHPGVRPLNEVA